MNRRAGTMACSFGASVAVLLTTAWIPLAAGEPATPVKYRAGSSATVTTGPAFDTCTAPSIPALRAWRDAKYYRVNIYFGGINRGCTQANLSAAWVRSATSLGYRLIPTYMGRQPSCMLGNKRYRYNAANAAAYGASEARDAVAKAGSLGLLSGSALYADVENYDRRNSSCVTAVRTYVSAWTKTLHEYGYLAGAYVHQDSGLRDLSAIYSSTTYARPDAVWVARWDGSFALTKWPTAPNWQWSFHQRAKQFRGDHNETWGGVTLNIDNDQIDAPVATVARSFRVTSSAPLNARTAPGTGYAVVRSYAPGATVSVICQGHGPKVGTSAVWDRLADGSWVSDLYVSTASNTTFSYPLLRCTYPGQVTSTTPLNARSGPGASYPVKGAALQPGALAYVMCQRKGSKVGSTAVWNKLADGRWVSDFFVADRSNTTWSTSIPRCPT